jgi:hypothetical protein
MLHMIWQFFISIRRKVMVVSLGIRFIPMMKKEQQRLIFWTTVKLLGKSLSLKWCLRQKKKITEEFSCFILFLLGLLCFVFSGYFTFLVLSFVSWILFRFSCLRRFWFLSSFSFCYCFFLYLFRMLQVAHHLFAICLTFFLYKFHIT